MLPGASQPDCYLLASSGETACNLSQRFGLPDGADDRACDCDRPVMLASIGQAAGNLGKCP